MGISEFIGENKYKIFRSILTYIAFAGLGGTNTLVGSSLLDLQIRVQRSFEAASRLVPARSIGYIVGASACGLLGERIDDYLALFLANLMAGIFLIIAPWFTALEAIITCIVISGFAQGILDIYCNVIILRIWGTEGINWLQALHMSFGFGALITPIFTRPFLLPTTEQSDEVTTPNSFVETDNSTGISVNEIVTISEVYSSDDVKVQYSFLILGGILTLVSVPFFFCYLHERRKAKSEKDDAKEQGADFGENIGLLKKLIAVFMTAILANLTFGSEAVIGNLCTAFAVKADIAMDKKTAVLLATTYWTMFSFYRLFFIPLTLVIKESRVFYFNLLIIIAGVVALVPHAAYKAIYAWIAFVLLGIGYSPCFSISFGSLGKYFHMSNSMTSFILVCGTLGETVHTTVLSLFIDKQPVVFVYYIGVMSLVYVAVSAALPFYLNKIEPSKSITESTERHNIEMQKY